MEQAERTAFTLYRVRRLQEANGELVCERSGVYNSHPTPMYDHEFLGEIYVTAPDTNFTRVTVHHKDLSGEDRISHLGANPAGTDGQLIMDAALHADPTVYKAVLKAYPSHDILGHYIRRGDSFEQVSFYRFARFRG